MHLSMEGQSDLLFLKGAVTEAADTIPYRWCAPEKMEEGECYPVVILLHGSGERGNDNQAQLIHGIRQFATPENRKKHPSFLLAPQCPKGQRWVEVDWKQKTHIQPDTISDPLRMVIELVRSMMDSLPIDTNRVYITGLSMGGYGTWDAVTRYPELFAAAVPVCGGGDEKVAANMKEIPVWAFHGDQDKLVLPERSTNMIEAVQKAGNRHAKITIFESVGHDSWVKAYSNPAMYEWLYKQRKHR